MEAFFIARVKQLALRGQPLVACVAMTLLLAGFVVACVCGATTIDSLALYAALAPSIYSVATMFFNATREDSV